MIHAILSCITKSYITLSFLVYYEMFPHAASSFSATSRVPPHQVHNGNGTSRPIWGSVIGDKSSAHMAKHRTHSSPFSI